MHVQKALGHEAAFGEAYRRNRRMQLDGDLQVPCLLCLRAPATACALITAVCPTALVRTHLALNLQLHA